MLDPLYNHMDIPMMPLVYGVNGMVGMNRMNGFNPSIMNPYSRQPQNSFTSPPPSEIATEVATEASSTARTLPDPRNLDFIAVVDVYPDHVQDMLAESRAINRICLSDVAEISEETERKSMNDSIEEIRRTYVPQPTPQAGSAFPPIISYNPWAGSTPIRPPPAKLANRMANRYDTSRRLRGQIQKLKNVNTDRSRLAPSNAPLLLKSV
jgi:hypothetical protein